MNKKYGSPFAILVFLFSCNNSLINEPDVSSELMEKTINYLSSPKVQGRLPGTYGYYLAADFLSGKFRNTGLQPLGNNDFFQDFTVESNEIKGCDLSMIKGEKVTYRFVPGKDYVCSAFSGTGETRSEVLFTSIHIHDTIPFLTHYQDTDMKGKIVMVWLDYSRAKKESIPDPVVHEIIETFRQKGATGMLIVHHPENEERKFPFVDEQRTWHDFPVMYVSVEAAEKIFEHAGKKKMIPQLLTHNANFFHLFPLDVSLYLFVKTDYYAAAKTMNVLGVLPGQDSVLKHEYVVLGANLDHLGPQGTNVYFSGAHDNASGVAAVCEMARLYAVNEVKPSRSVIFALFGAELEGSLGTRYFLEQCPVPNGQIHAVIYLDGLARGEKLRVSGGQYLPDITGMLKEMEMKNDTISYKPSGKGNRSVQVFQERGIPSLYATTEEKPLHFYDSGDLADSLNYTLYQKTGEVLFEIMKKVSLGE